MKVFLENFSFRDTLKIKDVVKDLEIVKTKEESEFWFPNTIKVEEVIDILVNGVEVEDEKDISQEDLEQRKA